MFKSWPDATSGYEPRMIRVRMLCGNCLFPALLFDRLWLLPARTNQVVPEGCVGRSHRPPCGPREGCVTVLHQYRAA